MTETPVSGPFTMSRRLFLAAAPLALAGCMADARATRLAVTAPTGPYVDPMYVQMYAAMPYEQFPIPAIDVAQVPRQFLRQEVAYATPERPGTIIVDPGQHFLYLVGENGMAMRYGIGVGRQGFSWSGRATIDAKREWPRWHPPYEMIDRDPQRLEQYRDVGMDPGINNPLGARALYLYQGGRDTLYRLHGTNEPWSIGQSVSSGCIRLFNQDIIDLYNRVPTGTEVVVQEAGSIPSIV